MSKSGRLKAMLGAGYFPEELPPPFTTADFARYRTAIGAAWRNVPNYPGYPKTVPERYSVPKVTEWRRDLSIVNPIAQFHVAKLIADEWSQIIRHFRSCRFGVVEVDIKSAEERAVAIPDFRLVSLRHAEISAIHNFVLTADISRFYGTLYTHAITWALHTKRWAKDNLHTAAYDNSLGARIDQAVRKGQDNQSMGIPVGPDTSRIISELVAVAIDAQAKSTLNLDADSVVRNVDDWYIGFDTRGQAEAAVATLVSAAREFELEIHPEKTKVIHVPGEVQPTWPSALRQIVISRLRSEQSKTIDHYFAQAFDFALKHKDQNVLRFAVNRISTVQIYEENWHQLETYLLKAARANATTVPSVAHILAVHEARGYPVNKARVAKLIRDIIANGGPSGTHYEIAWALFLAKALGIALEADWVRPVTALESSVCGLVLLDLRSRGLIQGDVDVSLWTQAMTQQGLNSNLWLMAYEADLKGWLTAPTPGYVQAHPYFAELRRRNISFYDDQRRLRDFPPTRPRGPSEAFLRHMATFRQRPMEFDQDVAALEDWLVPAGGGYGDFA